jgi:hypothetical protein
MSDEQRVVSYEGPYAARIWLGHCRGAVGGAVSAGICPWSGSARGRMCARAPHRRPVISSDSASAGIIPHLPRAVWRCQGGNSPCGSTVYAMLVALYITHVRRHERRPIRLRRMTADE